MNPGYVGCNAPYRDRVKIWFDDRVCARHKHPEFFSPS
ncbi:hypothetical protein GXM_06685 [Nostoc sphaeroides CCNUC1]|uniref:Uncharacterized protein n=1 Tax=Nostoc sphaeroides CCNUC1 TaxID=2653204 RepID=A0A5P8W9I4_9NOSO|nr:hypothetical protein GXM_06685 [Nostoc sphaeroides CCNUC1]